MRFSSHENFPFSFSCCATNDDQASHRRHPEIICVFYSLSCSRLPAFNDALNRILFFRLFELIKSSFSKPPHFRRVFPMFFELFSLSQFSHFPTRLSKKLKTEKNIFVIIVVGDEFLFVISDLSRECRDGKIGHV